LKRLVAITVILALLGLGASRAYDWWNFQVTTPVSTTSQPVIFHIQDGELPTDVAADLDRQHLLRNRTVF